MHVAHTIVETRCLELEAELSNLRDKSHNDNHDELVKCFSNIEVYHLNLQLKYQNLKDSFGNNPPTPDKDTLDFDSVFVIGKMQASLQGKDNVIKKLQKQISHLQETRSEAGHTLKDRAVDSQITQLTKNVTVLQAQNDLFKAENDIIKQHYKELYDSIKITRAKHIEQVTTLTTANVNLKAQILNTVNSVNKDPVKPTALTQGKYVIDVEPIVPRLRNNSEAHLDYLRHLKESVETIRDIVDEAKVVRPLDSSIVFACRYTKHSQELLEYVIGTYQCDKSNNNTHKHVAKLNTQKTNVLVPPSTRVNRCIDASRSHPRSNTKKNRISPAKGVNKLQVEEQPRTNKSPLRTSNHVGSSSRPKRTQTSSCKPYVPTLILEKIIIDLEDEVVSLLEKEKENLEIVKCLKSKGFKSSENAIFESKNQSENDCQVVEKGCETLENSKVIAPGMFKINVSQNLDTLSSVRRPKHSGVIWKTKGSSNTSNVYLSFVSNSKLNKDVKQYSREDLLSCNNYHHVDTRSAYACNDAMNVSCNSKWYASYNVNDLFIFDDVSIRNSRVSKMPFRKRPRDSLNVRSKNNLNNLLPRTLSRWLPKMQPLAEPVAKWIPKVKRQIDRISKTPNLLRPIIKWVPKVC
nr:hypothetical protein [Tanacetum cinerariifolium]